MNEEIKRVLRKERPLVNEVHFDEFYVEQFML